MSSPPPEALSGALSALEGGSATEIQVIRIRPVGGGCISPAAILESTGGTFFLKWNARQSSEFFAAEAEGLAALASGGPVRVPRVMGRSGPGEPTAWLLLEYVESGRAGPDWAIRLGRGLAELHRSRGNRFGWDRPNFIGSLAQANDRTSGWATFWWARRLEPRIRSTRDQGLLQRSEARLLESLEPVLPALVEPVASADGPSLLHGDLWSGNVMTDGTGAPVLIDPSVYHGHREVDLAMAHLFGGFPEDFFRAYDEAWPVQAHGLSARTAAYQLYPLLVHLELFGRGYVGSTLEAARSVLAA